MALGALCLVTNAPDHDYFELTGGKMTVIERTILVTGIVLAVIFAARWLERLRPIGPNLPHPEVMSDWKAVFTNLLLFWPVSLITVPCSAVIIARMGGGGLISIRTDGWWYLPSLIGFILVGDLYRYSVHRLQHKVPFLWSMHSFHHSANALTLITGARHLWLEKAVLDAFFPLFPILFSVPTDMAMVIGAFYFLPDGCAHLNIRFPMGWAITWINNPQWHRIHHSVLPQHQNKNFASALPLWDIVFGTAWIPRPDEYPPTGLAPSETVGVIDSIIWPFRHVLRRRFTMPQASSTRNVFPAD
jgi:sterol desaturase/sphingolipid hydroxylase (fatty acid hydroxylase superfamily)